ncbi:phage-related protein [Trichococcus patagoniensis]|uniref:Phage-related protein n=1 Tax=Trichococcus patagoniensis TaxID=382641 RepID=A0A2T5ILX0_9LACT|nr:phage tail family protein [Trichococcus patagoniensis]PTQ84790.1 phage-related protein [Trichococcus patagoniensis]
MPTDADLYEQLLDSTDQAVFVYGGIVSSDMSLVISKDTAQTSPEASVSFQNIPGRDGSLIIDNKRLNNFTYPIHTYLRPEMGLDINEAASRISQWLKGNVRYRELYLSWDSNYLYKAVYNEQFSITDILPRFGKIALNFKCHPIKYLISGQNAIPLTSGQTLLNPEKRAAKPLISITGTGDITLKKNGANWLILNDIDGSVTVDSESKSVYKDGPNLFEKMNATLSPLFPQLDVGTNVITWAEAGFSVSITPRWEAIV